MGEDCVYLEGGRIIIAYNKIYTQGETGGDSIILKAGYILKLRLCLLRVVMRNKFLQ